MNKFAERLKELRKERNLSQRSVGLQIGYSQQNVSDWEAGRIQPTALAIVACAEFFDVSSDYLLGLEGEDGTKAAMSLNSTTAKNRRTSEESELLRTFEKLSKTNKIKLLGVGIGLFESQTDPR